MGEKNIKKLLDICQEHDIIIDISDDLIKLLKEQIDETKDLINKEKMLIEEELNEFKEAVKKKDLKEAADALTDILYVTYGAGHAFGINLDKCFEEVQKSNMSKLGDDGKPIYDEKG